MSTSEKRQVPLSAAQAWERLQKTLSQTHEGRKAKTQIDDVAQLLGEPEPTGKRKRYQGFLLEVLRRCGLASVVLCAIGLGQAQVAMMNTTNRSSLLGILERNLDNPHLPRFRDMAPDKLTSKLSPFIHITRSDLLGIQVHRPRPLERSRDQYWFYKFSTADADTFSTYFSPRIRSFMEESCLRAWEMRRSVIGTEVVRTDIPKLMSEDCLMFLEVGLIQDLISELFPADKRIVTPSCCKFVHSPHLLFSV
jgi:hypothetical protein